MKNLFQVSSLLSACAVKSKVDWKRISGICSSEYKSPFAVPQEIDPEGGMDAAGFCRWLDEGVGAGDVCHYGDELVICGICTLTSSRIVARLSDGKLSISDEIVQQNALKVANPEERDYFTVKLMEEGFQFSSSEASVTEKFIPSPFDRVTFSGKGMTGIGVVKAVHPETDSVDYYCYAINETGQVGYSMDEVGVTGLRDVVFEPLTKDVQRTFLGNVTYLQRKFSHMLAKYGKSWNEKLHRIEPLEYAVERGKRYWYLGQDLVLKSALEDEGASAKKRRIAGNYFRSAQEGAYYQHKFLTELSGRFGDTDPEYVRIISEESVPRRGRPRKYI